MCKLLGVSETPLRKAIAQGSDYFAQYTRDRCGKSYKAINAAKPGAKIPRWKFEEIDDRNELL